MLAGLGAYLAIGVAVGGAFAVWGAGRVDPRADARGRAWRRFRALLVPGAAALWPLILVRWVRAAKSGSAGAVPPASRSMRAERRVHLAVWVVLTPVLLAAVVWAWRERDAGIASLRVGEGSGFQTGEEAAP